MEKDPIKRHLMNVKVKNKTPKLFVRRDFSSKPITKPRQKQDTRKEMRKIREKGRLEMLRD